MELSPIEQRGRGEPDFSFPEYKSHSDFLKRIEIQRKMVDRFTALTHGAVEQWARRYAVIFGDLWDDKLSLVPEDQKKAKPYSFRKLVFAEWQDTPEFFDYIQSILDQFRQSKIKKKLAERRQRKAEQE